MPGCLLLLSLLLTACATESHRAVDIEKVDSYNTAYTGEKTTLVAGKFHNRSRYLQGLFSADSDRLGNQSRTILKTHLQQTNRFLVVDRENLALDSVFSVDPGRACERVCHSSERALLLG
ncbi:MAG: hypothetical protein GY815_17210 [Gammaproteobacteria bacterium]|nr:hypothetical protein [Gammaproteobacteria bacterium]